MTLLPWEPKGQPILILPLGGFSQRTLYQIFKDLMEGRIGSVMSQEKLAEARLKRLSFYEGWLIGA